MLLPPSLSFPALDVSLLLGRRAHLPDLELVAKAMTQEQMREKMHAANSSAGKVSVDERTHAYDVPVPAHRQFQKNARTSDIFKQRKAESLTLFGSPRRNTVPPVRQKRM